jgi:pilus assembly protein Flp/PilA
MLGMLQTVLPTMFARFGRDEKGAAMVEYGLLVGLIALVVAGGATFLGQDISTMFKAIGTTLAGISTAA